MDELKCLQNKIEESEIFYLLESVTNSFNDKELASSSNIESNVFQKQDVELQQILMILIKFNLYSQM